MEAALANNAYANNLHMQTPAYANNLHLAPDNHTNTSLLLQFHVQYCGHIGNGIEPKK